MILVTGATGNSGSEIVKQFSAAGVPVKALVRNPEKAAAISLPGVEIVKGDLSQPETVESALVGVDKVVMVSPYHPDLVMLERNLIAAAQQVNIGHVIKFSVLGADPNAKGTIFYWHGQTEKDLEASGVPYTHLRPNAFMQGLLGFAGSIAQGGIYMPAADAKISWVDIRDIAAVAVKVATESGHEGKIYTITGPEALTYDEVAAKLSAAIGKPVNYVNVSPQDLKQSLLGFGLPEWMIDGINDLYEAYRAGVGATVTDTVKTVGKKDPISFDQFARDYAQAFTG